MAILSQYITVSQVSCRAQLNSKKQVLQVLSNLLATHTPEYIDILYEALLKRERLGNTALGKGIAIPHARITDIKTPQIAIITLIKPIVFESLDGKSVDIIVGLVLPEDHIETNISLLASITEMLADSDFIDQLRNTKDNAQLYDCFVAHAVTCT